MSPFELNFRHLLAVRAIAEFGSLSRAANAVHLSQPALTQGLVKLEGQLQHRLFDRKPSGMAVTAAGAELVARTGRAEAELVRALEGKGTATARSLLGRISFTHLRAVLAAVESGNFVLANRASGISSPAIHRAVREFERVTDLSLFERRGRTVAPTREARRVAAAARRAIAEIEAAIADLATMRGQSSGRVTVGALPLGRARLVPEAVAAFHAAQPGASVSIVDGSYAELLGRLIAGELDLIVGALRSPSPSPEVVQTPLYEDRLMVVARSGHPLREVEAPDLGALSRFPWIMAPRSAPMRTAWESMFRDGGLEPPSPAVECSSILAIHALLLEGDWLTLLSPEQVNHEMAAGRLITIGPPPPGGSRMIGVTVRSGWRPSGIQGAFLRLLEAQAATRRMGIHKFE